MEHSPRETYPFLQLVPLWLRIIKHLILQSHHNLAQEIVSPEHIGMPNCRPDGTRLQAAQAHVKPEYLIKEWIQRMLLDLCLAFTTFRFIWQQINLAKNIVQKWN